MTLCDLWFSFGVSLFYGGVASHHAKECEASYGAQIAVLFFRIAPLCIGDVWRPVTVMGNTLDGPGSIEWFGIRIFVRRRTRTIYNVTYNDILLFVQRETRH